jgi:hypothetical protein
VQPAVSAEDADGYGEIEAGAGLLDVGGGEVDGDAGGRNVEAGVLDGGADAVARLADGGVGRPTVLNCSSLVLTPEKSTSTSIMLASMP